MSHIQWRSDPDAKSKKRKGSVYMHGAQTNVQHRRVNPRQPRTTAQQLNRSIILFVSRSWRGLTVFEKASWHPCPGESLDGFYLFMSVNILGMEAGLPLERLHVCPVAKLFQIPYFVDQFQ